ncbi:MOSC domain-containing protein [bacterium]|nr:MAG: MOSC domain-containing protein [bacterium]
MPQIASLHIYPVKSLRGIAVEEATVERRGLAHDRRFMIVDETGGFMTQRSLPRMAQVAVAIEGERLFFDWHGAQASAPLLGEGPALTVRVWSSEVEAIHVSGADDLLSEALQTPCRLVRMPDSSIRPTPTEWSQEGDHVSFADGFPVLLANAASVRDLSERAGQEIPMARFRPNIVIEGAEPWAEDEMATVRIGELTFRNAKPCIRCSVTTLDQETGESRGPEPLATLAKFRRIEKGVALGSNLIPDAEGTLRVGDRVQSE